MLIEATPFAKSSSNGDNGSGWSIKRLVYPEDILPSFASLWCVCGAKICLKTTGPGLVSILTAQNYCNFSKLPTFYLLICIVFIPKACLTPPVFDLHQPLVLFVRQSWNGNNALLVMKASALLPSSPRVFCPLLSSSVLFPFFGKPSGFLRGSASYYCRRTDYKLLQERSPAILSCHGKTRASSVLRMAYRIVPFFMRSFFDCLPLFFFSTCVFVKTNPSNRGETLILM